MARVPGLIGLRVLYHKAGKSYDCELKSCRKKLKRGDTYAVIRQKMWGKFFADQRYHIDCVSKWIHWRIKQDAEKGRVPGRPALDLNVIDTHNRRNLIRRISRNRVQLIPAYEADRPERARTLLNNIGTKLAEIEEFDTSYNSKRMQKEIVEMLVKYDMPAANRLSEYLEQSFSKALLQV